MNMIEAVRSIFGNYANFNGRARRAEYWWWWLAQILLVFVMIIPMVAISPETSEIGATISLILIAVWSIGTLLPNITVTVRRLHDSDKTGWLYLLGLIPYIGGLILFVLMLLPGTPGENQYGDDPKDDVSGEIFA